MTPPDRLEPFERLQLMHRQGLDLDHKAVGALLEEVAQLKALDLELELLKARLRENGVAFIEREACAKVAWEYADTENTGGSDLVRQHRAGWNGACLIIRDAIRARGDK